MKKVFNILDTIIKVIFLISFIFAVILLKKVDIMPTNYMIIFMIIFVIIFILNFLSLMFKIKWLNIISIIFNLIFIFVIIIASIYLFKTDNFISKLNSNAISETYLIAVLKDSKYNKVEDLNNKKIGAFYNNSNTYKLAYKNIKNKTDLKVSNYNNLLDLTTSLLNNEVDAILINESSQKIIEEEHELIDLQLKYIYNVAAKTELEEIVKDIDVINNSFIVYISGIDTYGNIETISRSDVNILVVVNPSDNKVLLISIPRDYYVDIYGKNGKDKLTHAGIYGVETSVKTIENLLDVDINYYFKVNFSTLVDAIDIIDGINVYSPYTFNTYGIDFYEGYNYMDGTKALAFSRARYNFIGGDRVRGENQMRVIEAIIEKISSSRVLVTNYLDILESLKNSFQTNIDSNRIYDLVKFQLYDMPKWEVEKISLNGRDSYNYTYTSQNKKVYVMEPNINTIKTAKDKINKTMNIYTLD